MRHDHKQVRYSFEHGDKSLPHLKDLVSDKPDPMKSKIMAYLRTNCILACFGYIKDEINPDKAIGHGYIYSDGTYHWNDAFLNYVDRYNIPVPEEFRSHILENYNQRMKRHTLLRLINRIEIHNNPLLGFKYDVTIEKTGLVRYQNNSDCIDGTVLFIKPADAAYIVDPMMTNLFCYDSDEHGKAMIDGYHWVLLCYHGDELIDKIEGWPEEDVWRYKKFKDFVEFIEKTISKQLGSAIMKYYKDKMT